MIKKVVNNLLANKHAENRAELYRNLIRHEAQIGGQLFGEIPKTSQREFFCFDERTWIWHEEWADHNGRQQVRTTRYDVRVAGIFKAQDGQPYLRLNKQEAMRLKKAAHAYKDRVITEMYGQLPEYKDILEVKL